MRHRAALGLTAQSNTLVLIMPEETGRVLENFIPLLLLGPYV
ncbi:hypothetical protein [Metabacillus fastidiosus]